MLHRRLVVTVLSWADGTLRRSQIHDTLDSVAMRAVLLPGAGADTDVETVAWWVEGVVDMAGD